MSNEPEADIEPLGEEQRLTLLEQGRRIDRIVVFALAAVLAVSLASWLTYGVVKLFGDDQPAASSASVEALQQRVSTLTEQVAALQEQLLSQSSQLTALRVKPGASTTEEENPATRQQLAKTLIGQEKSFQEALIALKTGMRDLAGMIAGSRSWLEFYQESLDKPLAASRERVKDLQQWNTSQTAMPAPPATNKTDNSIP